MLKFVFMMKTLKKLHSFTESDVQLSLDFLVANEIKVEWRWEKINSISLDEAMPLDKGLLITLY